jgi:hypothetical protein
VRDAVFALGDRRDDLPIPQPRAVLPREPPTTSPDLSINTP